jgi:hypothetical protein
MIGFLSGPKWYVDLPFLVSLIVLGFIGLFSASVFLEALLKKRYVRPPRPASASGTQAHPKNIAGARSAELQDLGVWDGGDGRFSGRHTLMMEPGGFVLLVLRHGKSDKNRWFISQLADGRWMVTGGNLCEVDLTGLEDERTHMNVAFWELLAAHHARVRDSGQAPVPFAAEGLAEAVLAHQRACFSALAAAKLIRRRTGPDDAWSYGIRGAWKAAAKGLGQLRRGLREAREAEARSRDSRNRR